MKPFYCVEKIRSNSFKNVIYKKCFKIMYLILMYIKDVASNNLKWLICHTTKPNLIKTHNSP